MNEVKNISPFYTNESKTPLEVLGSKIGTNLTQKKIEIPKEKINKLHLLEKALVAQLG